MGIAICFWSMKQVYQDLYAFLLEKDEPLKHRFGDPFQLKPNQIAIIAYSVNRLTSGQRNIRI
jgi:hypothetical protein